MALTPRTIQLKRSANTSIPPSLANGEASWASNGGIFYIGDFGTVVAIGGKRTPGILTANQAIVVNSSSYVDTLKTGTLYIDSNFITTINSVANSTVIGASSNSELTTTWAIKTYVDGKVASELSGISYPDPLGAGDGLFANATHYSLKANNGILANSSGTFVMANNGLIANSSGLFLNTSDGLTLNSTGLFAKTYNGLTANSLGISVIAGNGLETNTTNLSVKANTALVSNATGLHVLANSGLIANVSGIFIAANNGLVANSLGLHLNTSDGLTLNSTALFVKAGTGIVVNSTGVHTVQNINTTSSVTFSSLLLGNSTSNLVANSTALKVSNSTSNITFTIPTTTEANGSHYLNGNGSYTIPAGGNSSAIVSEQFLANGTANSFTVNGGYASNSLIVFVNGVKQPPNTVNVASGTTANLIITPSNNAIVDVIGFKNSVLMQTEFDKKSSLSGLAYSNIIVNSNMSVSQENGNTAVTTSASYPVDQWEYYEECATMVGSAQQVTDAPPGYTNSIKMTITTAQASLAAGEYILFKQNIEGLRSYILNWGTAYGKNATLGFWVKSSVTGTFAGALRPPSASHCFVFSIVINATNTWEWKTVSIPAFASGTWPVTSAIGMNLFITLATGTTYTAPAVGWNTGGYIGLTGQSNLGATLSNTFQITGVILLPGDHTIADSEAYKIQRHYSDEKKICKRYYQKPIAPVFFIHNTSANYIYIPHTFPEMRVAPTVTFPSATNVGFTAGGGTVTMTTFVPSYVTTTSLYITLAHASAIGGHVGFTFINNARM